MGPYAFFVVGSYAVTALVVGALILSALVDHRAQVRALAELESRGTRRRSASPAPVKEPVAAGPGATPIPARQGAIGPTETPIPARQGTR